VTSSSLTVVLPAYNEAERIGPALDELFGYLRRRDEAAREGAPGSGHLPDRVDVLVVDDGSTDGTADELRRIAATDPRLRVIELSRRFGHQAALTAGLDHARGDAVVTIDGDLQDPPEIVPRLVEQYRAGADVVYAVRESREGETRFKTLSARWFYRLFGVLTEFELPGNSGDFRLMSRRAVDALLAMPERSRFLRGMTVWVGYTQTTIGYARDPRYAGETKYTLRRMLRFSADAFSSFSHVPLQFATALGFFYPKAAPLAYALTTAVAVARRIDLATYDATLPAAPRDADLVEQLTERWGLGSAPGRLTAALARSHGSPD